jgi:hypothetical protein
MKEAGRLALRTEGDNWVAYYALSDTMKGAIFLGSIKIRFVQTEARKRQFMMMMREAVADILQEITGERPTWPEPQGHPAPEHERAGRA